MIYNRGLALNKDWASGTWVVLLLTSAYTPNVDHDFISELVANEVSTSGTGYTRKNLTGRSVVFNDTTDKAEHLADAVQYTGLTCAFQYVAIAKVGTGDGDSELHSVYDLGAQSISGAGFNLNWDDDDVNGVVFFGQRAA